MFETLEEVKIDWERRLTTAANERNAQMHVAAVVTSDVDARMMVLRDYDPKAWSVRFHTDARAPKVATIKDDPRVAVLLYDKPAKVQIRARGIGTIVQDGADWEAAWQGSDNYARRCYLGEGPGALSETSTSGLPPQFEGVEPSDEEIVPGRDNFAVLRIELRELDWFYLAHTGHMRARFVREGDNWQGGWVSP